jgi:sugar/nucleoside kinase (ribokinase family)
VSHDGPVACFSYLASACLWTVARFPQANHGAEVLSAEQSVAADGPMTAAVLSALGVRPVLVCNDIGADVDGRQVQGWLDRYSVVSTASMVTGRRTPQIVVVADDEGTRTWLAHLPGVAEDLAAVDLGPLATAAFAYVDCYQVIEAPAIRAIGAARAAGISLLVNLGGCALSSDAAAALAGYPRMVVQTSTGEDAYPDARNLAAGLCSVLDAQWAVVTAGARGVVAVGQGQELVVPAFRAQVRHAHCAGAAFSGGLLYGLARDWPMPDSLSLACASGAVRCERAHDDRLPTLADLEAFARSRGRASAPAA